jgi:hypothetical protein
VHTRAAGHAQTSAPQASERRKVVINLMKVAAASIDRTALGLGLLAWFAEFAPASDDNNFSTWWRRGAGDSPCRECCASRNLAPPLKC